MQFWRFLCHTQFLALLTLFLYLGLTPSPEKTVPMFNDKLMHFSGYFVAALSISFAHPTRPLWLRAMFLILFSIGIEIGQHFMPPRSFDVLDIVANSMGAITGIFVIYLFYMIICNKKIGSAKGIFLAPANIDKCNERIAELFLGVKNK